MSRDHLSKNQMEATRLALSEIAEILDSATGAVIVGGTVPYLLIPQDEAPHEGTVDIDIVLSADAPASDDVFTFHEKFERRLYQQDPKKPFRYIKGFEIGGQTHSVIIELLCGGEPSPNGLMRVPTEDVIACVIPGLEVALEGPLEVSLPHKAGQQVLVASIPAFFAMKAEALDRRGDLQKSKDAYDIIYCLRHHPGGVAAIAEAYRDVLKNVHISRGVTLLRRLFETQQSIGPLAYASQSQDSEQMALLQREAFERVQELLSLLDRQSGGKN